MNVSFRWLLEFVPSDMSPDDVRDLLTSRVATVDDVVPLRQDLAGIIIGRVIEAAPHPDSDHLWVTKVDAGGGSVRDVVCGAPNVVAGALYPFAPVGSVLPGGLKLEKRKIRGALSEGMLCSAKELGLGQDHEGILALDVDAEPGTRFIDAMPVGDTMLIVDVLPNRPDLLSHEGIAREIAAATGIPLRRPQFPVSAPDSGNAAAAADSHHDTFQVQIVDAAGCRRYMGAHITGVEIGPSPDWLAARIEAVGGRSINNVVDATNYMLHGFGQPMHAFDLAKIDGAAIVVRNARPGEKLLTLDGIDRELDERMTVIADSSRAQAIAGVIGGKGSEVTESTTDLLLEVAAFDAASVRATRRRLGISTDASYRFERGVDPHSMDELMDHAIHLIVTVAGGRLAGKVLTAGSLPVASPAILLRQTRVAQVLGVSIPADDIARYLSSVGFSVEDRSGEMRVTAPSYRADVIGEIDLIEEVARLHGYSEFPADIRPFRPGTVPDSPVAITMRHVREAAVAAGLFEARPMPFVAAGEDGLRLRNPLAEDEAFLRTSVLDSLSRRAEYNLAHMQRNVRLFEIGTVFAAERDPGSGAPLERVRVGAVILGQRRPSHFTEPRPPLFDAWDAKALGVNLARAAYPRGTIALAAGASEALWTLTVDGIDAGEVKSLALDAPVWAATAYGIEIELPATGLAPSLHEQYVPIPAMPSMQVDLALVVPDGTTAARVEALIREEAGELLESLVLFDEFRGAGVPEGNRSLAWALTFRHRERTLREKEINGRTSKILTSLEKSLGIRQRTT